MMQNSKDNIRQKLLTTGRCLVLEKGADFLTARKLSDASGCSVGTIYNQFSSMDDFIAEQNEQTLSELFAYLSQLPGSKRGYHNIILYVDCFQKFVAANKTLWSLFYNFHLNSKDYRFKISYRRKLVRLGQLITLDLMAMFPRIDIKKLKASQKVLEMSLIALSALSTETKNNRNIALLLNTYLAGMMMLNKE